MHKSKDNQLMWESFQNGRMGKYSGDMQDGFNYGEEDFEEDMLPGQGEAEVVVELDPVGEVEPEIQEPSEEPNEIVYADIKALADYSNRLIEICKTQNLEPWMVAKISKASDYVTDVWHRVSAKADFANTGFEQSGDLSEF